MAWICLRAAGGLVHASLLALAALALLRPCAAQIRVLAPRTLANEFKDTGGKISGATATFGAPFYGDRVLGRLVYAEPKSKDAPHCTEQDYDIPPPEADVREHSYKEVRLIDIIMVRRGKCSFTTKVKVARSKGAHAVIFIDKEDSTLSRDDVKRLIITDDGFGETIHIPSILISKDDGAKLIAVASGKTPVVVELQWDVPTDHVVNLDLWMSSASKESNKFLKEFGEKRKVLNEVMKFQPHYAVFAMPQGDTAIYNELCSDMTGQYCAEDPDGAGKVTGRDVLDEDVRQLCIHELTKVKQAKHVSLPANIAPVEYAEKYWNYVERLLDSCPLDAEKEDDRFGRHCSERVMTEVGLDVGKVQECVVNTRDEKLAKERENIAWSPRALRINGWRYDGILNSDLVTRAVCAGFINQPEECTRVLTERDPFSPTDITAPANGGVHLGLVVAILVGMGMLGVIVMAVYKRYLKESVHRGIREEVMLEVQSQMGAYTQMSK